ncbi:MAG: FHA domain-containing protein [Smithellaceae bacterium]
MIPPYYVEVLSRSADVKYRYATSQLPIRVGRGYDNDVILDDPHVAAHHAVIDQTQSGELTIRDLGSQNGLVYKGARRTEVPIDPETVIRLGHTTLRVRGADYPVAGEVFDTLAYRWEGWRPALAGLALLIVITLLTTWVYDTDEFEPLRYLGYVALILAIGTLWCGIWAFANRLFGGGARFGRHLFILGCGFAAIQLWDTVLATLAFAFSLEMLTRYGSHLIIGLFAVTVFFHLRTVHPRRSPLSGLICVALAFVVSGMWLMNNYYRYGQTADELYMHQILPPAVRQSADQPVARLLSDTENIRVKVDAKRTQPVNGPDDDTGGQDW